MKGDCFLAALHLASAQPTWVLVHGLPIGTGDENRGRRYWHAWCERNLGVVDVPVNGPDGPTGVLVPVLLGWEVIDLSNDREVRLPASVFYNAGRLDGSTTWRYDHHQRNEIMARTRTAGPWVEGWKEMGL